jgi:hypothetical protein
VPAAPSWLPGPLWDQSAALLPGHPVYAPSRPLGCRPFPPAGLPPVPARWAAAGPGSPADHLRKTGPGPAVRLLIWSYGSIAACACSADTVRNRRAKRVKAGIFARLRQIALEAYDRIVGLVLEEIIVDGCIGKAPGGGERAGRSPVDRGKQGMRRSCMTGGHGMPLDRALAPASRRDSPLLAPALDRLDRLGPLPDDVRVHLDAGYDSRGTRDEPAARGMTGQIAHKGEKAPISRPGSAGPSSAPTPGTTPSPGCNAATSGARKSSAPSSVSPMPSSRS